MLREAKKNFVEMLDDNRIKGSFTYTRDVGYLRHGFKFRCRPEAAGVAKSRIHLKKGPSLRESFTASPWAFLSYLSVKGNFYPTPWALTIVCVPDE